VLWNSLGERSCYDEGKRTAETLAMDYHRGADVEVIVFDILLDCKVQAIMTRLFCY
jgi:hypothetical protein